MSIKIDNVRALDWLDARYLKLDTSNDPLTGTLNIQRNGIGTDITKYGLSLENATAATSGQEQIAPTVRFLNHEWDGSADQTTQVILSSPGGWLDNPAFKITGIDGAGFQSTMLEVDYWGQFKYPVNYNRTQGETLYWGFKLTGDGAADVTTDRYSPAFLLYSTAWATGGGGSSQYMSSAFLNAPEQGVTNPIGVLKWIYGTNTQTPSEANEMLRMEWGDRAGIIVNEQGLDRDFRIETLGSANTLSVDGETGNVGIGLLPSTTKFEVNGSAKIANDLDVDGGAGFGSSGATTANVLVDVAHSFTNTSGIRTGIWSDITADPASSSTASYRALRGMVTLNTAQTYTKNVVGVYGMAKVAAGINATHTGSSGPNGLLGMYSTTDAADAVISYAAGCFFDLPTVGSGTLTKGYGLRIGQASVGSGSITTLYGVYFPSITEATNNWDIFHGGSTPNIGIASNSTLTWTDNNSNKLMALTDNGTTGSLEVNGVYYNSNIVTFADGAATPSVADANIFKTANTGATTITSFTGANTGQRITVIFTDANTTIQDGANLNLSGGVNFVSTSDDVLELIYDGTSFYEISRSVN